MRRDAARQPPRRDITSELFNPFVAVQIYKIDGESHAKSVDGFTWNYPDPLSCIQPIPAQEALPSLMTLIGNFHAGGKNCVASQVRDLEVGSRGPLVGSSEMIAQPRKEFY